MTKHDRWYSNPTQRYWTCKALIEGRTISTKTEIREVKGWRLAAIIETLKNDYDWPIQKESRGAENIAYYSLSPNTDISKLKYPPSAKALAAPIEGAGI